VTTVNAEHVRIPKSAREAVARHERVVVVNRDRPVLALIHPDDLQAPGTGRRGRRVRDIVAALAGTVAPDPEFANDMDAILKSVGPAPEEPWEPS
jgi:hypothetical protein